MKSTINIVPICTGTPMRIQSIFKWVLEFKSEYYSGKIESEDCFDSKEQAYENLMELQGDDAIYTILNLSDCTNNYKESDGEED